MGHFKPMLKEIRELLTSEIKQKKEQSGLSLCEFVKLHGVNKSVVSLIIKHDGDCNSTTDALIRINEKIGNSVTIKIN